MHLKKQGSLFVPTRNIWVPRRSLRDCRGFISPSLIGAIAGSRMRTAGWTPADLGSDNKFWVYAGAGLTLTGNDVDAWADQSGNGRNLDTPSANNPQYNATGGPNSLPCVDFAAASSNSIKHGSAFTAQARPLTIGIVAKHTDTAANQFLFDTRDSGGASRILIFRLDSTTFTGYLTGATIVYGASDLAGSWKYYVFQYPTDATQSTLRVNGAAYSGPGSGGGDSTAGFILGARYSADNCLNGAIAEMVLVNGVDSTNIRDKLETYFASKYAL